MFYTIGRSSGLFQSITTGYAKSTKQAVRILRKLKPKSIGYQWAGVWKQSHGERHYEDLRKFL